MKWYFKTSVVVIALLSAGPLALPLVWFHPHYTRFAKILTTVITIILTLALGKALETSMQSLLENYRVLADALAPAR